MANLEARLAALDEEYNDGEITQKGYEKRRTLLMQEFAGPPPDIQPPRQEHAYSELDPLHFGAAPQLYVANPAASNSFLAPSDGYNDSNGGSRTHTLGDFSFKPSDQAASTYDGRDGHQSQDSQAFDSRVSTMLDSQQQGFFSDFGDNIQEPVEYGGAQRYSAAAEPMSPTAIQPAIPTQPLPSASMINHQMPLEPRDIPFSITDSHDPNTQMSQFESIGGVLRHRGKTHARQAAYWVLDAKGKEVASITYEKLASKAEKVAQVIRFVFPLSSF